MATRMGYGSSASRQVAALTDGILASRQGDKRERMAAIHLLGRLIDDGRAIAALTKALESEDADIRALAMGKLVFARGKAIVPTLLRGLDDGDPRVREHALYALRRQKATSAADKITLLLKNEANEVVRLNAAWALAVVAGRRHVPAFVRALNDPNTHIVLAAIKALATLAPRDVHWHILKLVRDAKRWGRLADTQRDVILYLLRGDLRNKSVADLLRGIVLDGIAQAKREGKRPVSLELLMAACLLSEIGDAAGVPVLMEGLKGGEYWQQSASVAMGRLREKSAVPLILEYPMKNGFYPVMRKAVRALGQIGDTRALPALAGFFNDRVDDFPVERSLVFTKDEPELRLTALVAMAKIAAAGLDEAACWGDPFDMKVLRGLLAAPV